MVGRWSVGVALVGVALLAAGCGAIEDLGDDLSTITVPEVTIPDVTLPDVTLPDLTLPDLTLPDVTLPDVTLPDVTLPDVSLPDILPEVTLPELTTTTTVFDQATTTAPAPSSTTSVVAVTTTQPPATTTTSSAPTTSTTRPLTTTTTQPPATTTVADTTTGPSTTSTVVEAAPSTTLPEEDEGRSALWWVLALAVIGAGIAAWAIYRTRKEAGELAARQAEWDDRIRGAYIRGRWVLDQFDDRLPAERSVDADPRGLRAGVETVVEDLYQLEADAVNVQTRAMVRELSDTIRGLDRATDVAAGILAGGDEQSSVEAARARLDAALERLASTLQPDPSPPV